MKPNFALSLSFEGIRLLHRAAGGWRVVGEVALDAADMPAELAVLRRTATALEPGGLRTKLLLPTEQIKYLTIESKDMDDEARMAAARKALDGATPYPVEDLAFDISADGDTTHVAAVARETLAEAESFATEHRFHPTSFATIPSNSPYLGEPFFGATKASVDLLEPGEQVEPDGIAVVVIGDARVPTAPKEDVALAEPEDSDEADLDPIGEDTADLDTSAQDDAKLEDAEDKDVAKEMGGNPAQQSDTVEENAPNAPEAAAPLEAKDTEEIASTDAAETGTKDSETTDEESADPIAEDSARDPEKTEAARNSKDNAALSAETSQEFASADESVKDGAPEAVSKSAAEPAKDKESKATAAPLIADGTPDPIPTLPSLGAASRAAPAALSAAVVAAPTGFASRRGADQKSARQEPVVTAPSLPVEADSVVNTANVTDGSLPPAPLAFTTHATNAPDATPPAPKDGFLSRRKAKAAQEIPAVAGPAAGAHPVGSEAERMTVFGARRDVGGKPRFLGLILTAVLLVFLAGVAAWASVFLDDGLNLSRLFGDRSPKVTANAPQEPEHPVPATFGDQITTPGPEDATPQVRTASLTPTLSEEDSAVLDALSKPVQPQNIQPTDNELEASYATSGIWPLAPVVPPEPAGLISIEDLYITGIDPVSTANDAVALPAFASFATDVALGKVSVPAAAGTVFKLDAQGQVIATVEGALSPDGFTVYLGRPDFIPPPTPARFQAVPDRDPARLALVGARPKARPGDLSEQNERANLDGLTRSELAGFRPQFRPKSVQEQAAAAVAAAAETPTVDTNGAVETALATPEVTNSFDNATRLAIQASVRPDTRPRNFARIVRRAQRAPQPETETRVATVAPRVVTPKVPSSASVAKQATVRNAINLRKVNLIGVYGKPSSRRALVRLANGRYKKVVVGDRIDGGRVSAIGDSELRYNKSGRSVVLKMPRS